MDVMKRRLLSFTCEGLTLAASLDEAAGSTGLLIVSGGNEIRIGAHRGMAKLGADIAAMGSSVFRFDRRGVGDSEGENTGFENNEADIKAALSAFRAACPHVKRVVAFGNCDAATALLLHQPLAIDAFVLANPWLFEASAEAPAPATARAYYRERLKNPHAWLGLFKGAINFGKLFGSLRTAIQKDALSPLSTRVAEQMARHPVETIILLAERDGTATAFKAQWDSAVFDDHRVSVPITMLDSASHSFASDTDYAALVSAIRSKLG